MTVEEAKEAIKEAYGNSEYTDEIIEALEQKPKTWSLDDAREDFMCDVYNTLNFLPTNNEANWIIDSFDRVTSSIRQQPYEDYITKLIREFDKKHPTIFAFYMEMFNSHPLAEIIDYMWDMHDLIEDIRYRLPMEVDE